MDIARKHTSLELYTKDSGNIIRYFILKTSSYNLITATGNIAMELSADSILFDGEFKDWSEY